MSSDTASLYAEEDCSKKAVQQQKKHDGHNFLC